MLYEVITQPRPYYIAVPYIDNPMFERAKEAQQKGLSFYSDVLTPEENRHWHKHVFDHNDLDFVITSYSIHYTKLYETPGISSICTTNKIHITRIRARRIY